MAANDQTDRVILAANDGTVIALHDKSYPTPLTFQAPPAAAKPEAEAPAKPAEDKKPGDEKKADDKKPAEDKKPAGGDAKDKDM